MKNIMIKVCGMRDVENIRAVAALGVDMIGFVFWKDSPRYVSMMSQCWQRYKESGCLC